MGRCDVSFSTLEDGYVRSFRAPGCLLSFPFYSFLSIGLRLGFLRVLYFSLTLLFPSVISPFHIHFQVVSQDRGDT